MKILPYRKIAASFNPWTPAYLEVAQQLIDYLATERFSVIHFGSTSFKVGGKGIIDLSILYPSGELDSAVTHVLNRGFQDQVSDKPFPPERPRKDGAVFVDGTMFYIHLHVIEHGSENHRKQLAYKTHMLANTEARVDYEASKKKILANGVTEQEAYGEQKSPHVKSVLQRIDDAY
ncbi:GrpB family protein [Psychrobium sp. 1_MG-2023]|uniref:GrpB family protein n=1 Tax=Psychrobium sp. 1_MG-2023 TaxID=3062624 RepID=UPI000C33C2B2|nr:GrpB family protein [Psychrobium sp. 1_MG-2023]MDP2562444.1 GrpB family protein [Psychrobium sp. 1_MG-2023]PKF56170.1 hypothetical protein CW748_10970 [Alteromonadales bacterium alter-6D02]